MLIHAARAGGELPAHTAVLIAGDRPHRGQVAEALWLGVGHMLSNLLGGQLRGALAGAASACGIRPIDAEFAVCLSGVGIPELGRKAGVEVGVSEGVEGWTAAPAPEADCAEGRKRLKQAAA